MSCRLLDDLPLDEAVVHELMALARTDENKRVRHQAWHAATCTACKPAGVDLACGSDPLTVVTEELQDRSLRVRRAGATGLLFSAVAPDADVARLRELVDRVLSTETDDTIVARAKRTFAVIEQRTRAGG